MPCEICEREFSSSRKAYCPLCAGSELYHLRYAVAKVSLEKESIEEENMRKVAVLTRDQLKSKAAMSSARIQQMHDRKMLLKEELAERSNSCKAARENLQLRRSRFEALRRSSKERSPPPPLADNGDKHIKVLHNAVREKRVHLCRAFVDLSRLIPTLQDEQSVLNLVNLKKANPEEYNASVLQISNLLVRVANTLGIRLPAEVLLPRNGDPSLGVRIPSFSYITPRPSSSRSAFRVPRLPLFLEKDLASLMQDDMLRYTRFIDALSLLAYNVAYVCHTQGFCVGKKSLKNVFDLRNLVRLFSPSKQDSETQSIGSEPDPRSLGKYSHATSQKFLGGIEATKFIRSTRLPEYELVRRELRNILYDEENVSLSWELVDSSG